MSDLVHNEETKILANALDRASTACLSLGVLAPIAGAFYNVAGMNTSAFWPFVLCVLAWFLAAYALHLEARRAIKELRS